MKLLLGIAVALLIALLLLQRRKPAATTRTKRRTQRTPAAGKTSRESPRRSKSAYAAVTIKPGKSACARVLERARTPFLESAAPTLPVLGCDSPNCQCVFVHLDDRRRDAEGDRRMGIGLKSELYAASEHEERRERSGRRLSDH